MARIHFIVNPLRPSIGLRWPYEEKRIEALTKDFSVHITRGRLHAEILVREAIQAGAELIVCVGGDSTLNEIANGLYRASLGGGKLPALTVYSGLQAGDAVKSLNPAKDFLVFLQSFLDGKAEVDRLDLGEIEFSGLYGQKVRRTFINCAGCGFSSAIVDRLSRDYRLSRSRFGFFKILVRMIPFYRHPDVRLSVDGELVVDDAPILTALVHNGKYAGYGVLVSPDSSMNDRKLELTIVRKAMGYRYLLSVFPLFAGQIKRAGFVRQLPCREVRIEASGTPGRKTRIDFDGDTWGFLPARMRILDGVVSFMR